MDKQKKSSGLGSAILELIVAIILAGIGIFAYLNDYQLLLFGIIPLNAIAFGVLAAILLVLAIISLARALSNRGK
jgi:hypothetical protein